MFFIMWRAKDCLLLIETLKESSTAGSRTIEAYSVLHSNGEFVYNKLYLITLLCTAVDESSLTNDKLLITNKCR